MMATLRRWAGVAAVLSLGAIGGCSNMLLPGPDGWRRVVGVTEIGGQQPAPLSLPAQVRRGVPFTATVTTWGSGSCTRPYGAEVRVEGLLAEVTPYDIEARQGVCTDDLRPYPRDVTLRFDVVGEAAVRVLGRPLVSGGTGRYEARVTVVP